MKLRTLKDLKDLDLPVEKADIFGFSEILKQEAIRWVKDCKTIVNGKKCIEQPSNLMEKCSGCERFTKFFNITESDLK